MSDQLITNKRLNALMKKIDGLRSKYRNHCENAIAWSESEAKALDERDCLRKRADEIYTLKHESDTERIVLLGLAMALSSSTKEAHNEYEECNYQIRLWTKLAAETFDKWTKLDKKNKEIWLLNHEKQKEYADIEADYNSQLSQLSIELKQADDEYNESRFQAKVWAKDSGKLDKRIIALDKKIRELVREFNASVGLRSVK